jgi:hypothetical protein
MHQWIGQSISSNKQDFHVKNMLSKIRLLFVLFFSKSTKKFWRRFFWPLIFYAATSVFCGRNFCQLETLPIFLSASRNLLYSMHREGPIASDFPGKNPLVSEWLIKNFQFYYKNLNSLEYEINLKTALCVSVQI